MPAHNGVSKGALQCTEMATASSTSLAASIRSSVDFWAVCSFQSELLQKRPSLPINHRNCPPNSQGSGGKGEGGGGN